MVGGGWGEWMDIFGKNTKCSNVYNNEDTGCITDWSLHWRTGLDDQDLFKGTQDIKMDSAQCSSNKCKN